jgi:AmmeMemoRadiSam system protein B
MTCRPAAVAGWFYPSGRSGLAVSVDDLLDRARQGGAGGPAPVALVVPHAGYLYSGPVAASGYAWLSGSALRRVILLGPAHRVPLTGMACSTFTRWRTPLGEVGVERVDGVPADDRAHDGEHSLEVQLPFLQRVLEPGFTIVPIAVGRTRPEQVAALLDRLEADLPGLVVVSTDLSHYHDAATAQRLDRRTAQAVLDCDASAIGEDDACGAWALRGLVEHTRRRGRRVRLLDRRTSADTAGDASRVVGYAAFAITEG